MRERYSLCQSVIFPKLQQPALCRTCWKRLLPKGSYEGFRAARESSQGDGAKFPFLRWGCVSKTCWVSQRRSSVCPYLCWLCLPHALCCDMWIQSASWSFLDITYLLCSSFTTPPHTSFESSPPSSSLTCLGLIIPSTLSAFWAQRESLMTATQTQTEQRTSRHTANYAPRMWAAVGLNGSKRVLNALQDCRHPAQPQASVPFLS